jgi:hypothetical protein
MAMLFSHKYLWEDYNRAWEDTFCRFVSVHLELVQFEVRDTSAAKSFSSDLWQTEIVRKSDVVLVCSRFDTPGVFEDVKSLCQSVLDQNPEVLIMVVRTQADRNNRWIEFGKTLSFCKRCEFPLLSCSVHKGINVSEVFITAATMVMKQQS